MIIKKYIDFINEEMNDTPESYVEIALKQIKRKIDAMFEFQEGEEEPSEISEIGQEKKKIKTIGKARADSKKKSKMSFKDLGVWLESSEISKYSKMYDSLTVKFSDDAATYDLFIAIDLKEAIPPKESEEDFTYEDIKKCFIKFKKYNKETFEVIGQITKNIEISNISEDFLIDLKVEIDDKFGEEEEEFEIETK